MNIFKKIYCRLFQQTMRLASYFLNFSEPTIIFELEGALTKIYKVIQDNNSKKVMIITDANINKLGYLEPLIKTFEENKIDYLIYDEVGANPTIKQVNKAYASFVNNNADSLIAVGGGSVMDLAKLVGARYATNKEVPDLKGVLKIRGNLPLLIAVPTTAGTGSEATLAAVVTDSDTGDKYAVNDPHLIPKYAVLAPDLTLGLPPHLTSSTGMDALTHAIEAYIGHSNTRKTKNYAEKAVKLIFENILNAYNNPKDINTRYNMLYASYLAGVSFTRAYVGYVHALAHSLGGKYNVPHGLANAILLPHVLESYGKSAQRKLAKLYDVVNGKNSLSIKERAYRFIQDIRTLNRKMNIPEKFEVIKEEDLDFLVNHALKEANPLYPVPKIFDKDEFYKLYRKVM